MLAYDLSPPWLALERKNSVLRLPVDENDNYKCVTASSATRKPGDVRYPRVSRFRNPIMNVLPDRIMMLPQVIVAGSNCTVIMSDAVAVPCLFEGESMIKPRGARTDAEV